MRLGLPIYALIVVALAVGADWAVTGAFAAVWLVTLVLLLGLAFVELFRR